jgi:hypothetical protein
MKQELTLGEVGGYQTIVAGDAITILKDGEVVTRRVVEGLGKFVEKARDLKLGWGRFPDFEVIYFYDKADDNFGYGLNLQDEWCSEWGYAPFE